MDNSYRITTLDDVCALEAAPPHAGVARFASVYEAIAGAAQAYAERPALTFVADPAKPQNDRSLSYAELHQALTQAANLLRRLGADEHSCVALLLPNIPEMQIALWAAETASRACPINYLLTVDHIADLLRASGARVLVALGPDPRLDIWDKACAVRERFPDLQLLVVGAEVAGALRFETALRGERGDALTFARSMSHAEVAALFHTGGTTGVPKLVKQTHGNQLSSAWASAVMLKLDQHDAVINPLPMFHVAGSIAVSLAHLICGAHIVMPTLLGLRNPAALDAYWGLVERFRTTIVTGVPTMIATLLNVPINRHDVSSLRAFTTGGAPVPEQVAQAFSALTGARPKVVYGMTETSGLIAMTGYDADYRAGSCGLAPPFTRVLAVHRTDAPIAGENVCASGETGVLVAKGPTVSPGYVDSRHDAGTFLADGWIATGDMGHVDAPGEVHVTGRAKDLIIRSGHNIDPGLIEDALMSHPAVMMAAAIGQPDAYAGELPVAYAVLKPGSPVSAQALLAHACERIAERPAWPKRLELLEVLPMTGVGKVYKPALRIKAIAQTFSDLLADSPFNCRVLVQEHQGGFLVRFEVRDPAAMAQAAAYIARLMRPYAMPYRVDTAAVDR